MRYTVNAAKSINNVSKALKTIIERRKKYLNFLIFIFRAKKKVTKKNNYI